MDLTSYAQAGLDAVEQISVLVAIGLVGIAARKISQHFGFTISQGTQDLIDKEITSAIEMGVGLGRAQLAAGKIDLTHVTLGNPAMDALAMTAINSLSEQARASGVTVQDISQKIVAGIGHAVGDDPTIPSVPSVPSAMMKAPTSPSSSAIAQ